MSEKIKREIYSWIKVILVVIFLRATFVESMIIPTGSMEKTLLIGDAVLVNRFIYGIKIPIPFSNKQIPIIPGQNPQTSDIIVFMSPFENKYIVKRCVAVEDDTVQVVNKVLYVNGVEVVEPYVYHTDKKTYHPVEYDPELYQQKWENAQLFEILGPNVRDNFGPVVVPKDHIFAMGDNRDISFDSRFWGPLHKKHLVGKPLFIFFSFDPGGPGSNIFDMIKLWQWRAIRLMRIGHVVEP